MHRPCVTGRGVINKVSCLELSFLPVLLVILIVVLVLLQIVVVVVLTGNDNHAEAEPTDPGRPHRFSFGPRGSW